MSRKFELDIQEKKTAAGTLLRAVGSVNFCNQSFAFETRWQADQHELQQELDDILVKNFETAYLQREEQLRKDADEMRQTSRNLIETFKCFFPPEE